MGHRDMIWSRHQPAQLLAWGIRFFLAAALTATQTPGDYAPFALGKNKICRYRLPAYSVSEKERSRRFVILKRELFSRE